jgi:hypothetical protein
MLNFAFVIKIAGVSRGTIALKVRNYIKFVLIFSENWFFGEVTSLWEKLSALRIKKVGLGKRQRLLILLLVWPYREGKS